jgi:hypothetical protein
VAAVGFIAGRTGHRSMDSSGHGSRGTTNGSEVGVTWFLKVALLFALILAVALGLGIGLGVIPVGL